MMDATTFAQTYLQQFKERMRITGSDEDRHLKSLLSASWLAIIFLVGADELDEVLVELVFERARYVYHDALDEFQHNYADEIEVLTIAYRMRREEDVEREKYQG